MKISSIFGLIWILALFVYFAFLWHGRPAHGYSSISDLRDPMERHRPQSKKKQILTIVVFVLGVISFFAYLSALSSNL